MRRAVAKALLAATAAGAVGLILSLDLRHAREAALPLADTAIIREQAAAKHLDPALIAAVIDAETHFEPRPSTAGAQGLMQLLPSTAYYLAQLSGGSGFTARDLATPAVNIAYGSYYLRYLLDRFAGNEMLAIAAYNGGVANVEGWLAHAEQHGETLTVAQIPFAQTREYVRRVLAAQAEYHRRYADQLDP